MAGSCDSGAGIVYLQMTAGDLGGRSMKQEDLTDV
jgi:hypothetical protein